MERITQKDVDNEIKELCFNFPGYKVGIDNWNPTGRQRLYQVRLINEGGLTLNPLGIHAFAGKKELFNALTVSNNTARAVRRQIQEQKERG